MLKNRPFHYSVSTRIRNSFIKKYLNLNPNNKVLDVGYGVRYYSKLLLEGKVGVYQIKASKLFAFYKIFFLCF